MDTGKVLSYTVRTTAGTVFMFTIFYRPATFSERGLWPTPRQRLKSASSMPSILEGPKDLGVWEDDEYLIPTMERSMDS